MKEKFEIGRESEILFSQGVKAGKRVYYFDIKRDRRGEFYLAMTESKRVKDGSENERPVFEKHKVFVYREDLRKFQRALNEAIEYVAQQGQLDYADDDFAAPLAANSTFEMPSEAALDAEIDIEF